MNIEATRPALPVTLGRLRQLHSIGLAALALPALLLGVPLGWGLHYPPGLGRLLALVGLGCTLLSLYLAWRQSREAAPHGQPDSRLGAALTLASATGVPLLLASVLWRQAAALWPLLALSAVAWALSWWLLGVWAGEVRE